MVKPVALQDNLGKTPAAERIAQIEKSQPELAQRETKNSVQRRNVEQQKKATAPEKGDEVIIHKDQQQKQDESKKQNKENQSEDYENDAQDEQTAEDEQDTRPPQGGHLDIQA